MKFLKSVYVKFVNLVLNVLLFAANKLMRHSLLLQGFNPDLSPGEYLYTSLCKGFTEVHGDAFDKDFNVDHFFEKYNKKDAKIDVTLDEYKAYTCLDNCTDPVAVKAE